jgi:hypothetical protein
MADAWPHRHYLDYRGSILRTLSGLSLSPLGAAARLNLRHPMSDGHKVAMPSQRFPMLSHRRFAGLHLPLAAPGR